MFNFIVIWICFLNYFTLGDLKNETGQLVTVVLVYRHGDRVIINPYPTDPYKNSSYWPAGWGQLTNLGKSQEYKLGSWLRDRYQNFLPIEYSEKDIYVRSTDVDRTLMSAAVNLAGLYPPKGKQVWDVTIPWQPIPIHTRPEKEDYLVSMKKPCPKYDLLKQELRKSSEFVKLNEKYKNLMDYIADHSGAEIDTFEHLEYIYNTLMIEKNFNFTLPDWTKSVFPDQMRAPAALSFAVPCYTSAMARLKTGPFFNELLNHLFNVTDSIKHSKYPRKIWMYSGHDVTIASILQSLRIFEYHSPPYSSIILFELYSKNFGQYYVNVLYKNSSQPQKMTLKGCDYDCPLETFVSLLDPININVKDWENECKLSLLAMVQSADKEELLVVAGVLFISLVIFAIMIKVIYSKYNKPDTVYLRLPDDDEQV